jgi:hypothetical protein
MPSSISTEDKGGHRAKAIDLIKQARDEVKAGIAFDNEHDKDNKKK